MEFHTFVPFGTRFIVFGEPTLRLGVEEPGVGSLSAVPILKVPAFLPRPSARAIVNPGVAVVAVSIVSTRVAIVVSSTIAVAIVSTLAILLLAIVI